jgi:hypothetical protein
MTPDCLRIGVVRSPESGVRTPAESADCPHLKSMGTSVSTSTSSSTSTSTSSTSTVVLLLRSTGNAVIVAALGSSSSRQYNNSWKVLLLVLVLAPLPYWLINTRPYLATIVTVTVVLLSWYWHARCSVSRLSAWLRLPGNRPGQHYRVVPS